jgi:hypothetical protein
LAKSAQPVRYAYYAVETGHNIPDVFLTYMNATGQVQDASGQPAIERVFDWVYVMGYPITEPFWAKEPVTVAGQPRAVLIQLFERRALTYTPANPAGWQVEMGNVGRHYYTWRYGQQPPSSSPDDPTAAGS